MALSWLVATLLIPPLFLAGLAAFIWQRRSHAGGVEFIFLLCAVALWGATSAVEKLVFDLDVKLWIAKLQYLGIVAVPPSCVAVGLAASRQSMRRVARLLVPLSLPGLLIVCAIVTNEWHQLFWRRAYVDVTAGIPILKLEYGPGFWLHAGWSYLLVTFAIGLLVAKWSRSWSIYRGEAIWVLAGIATPLAANLAYLSRTGSTANLDLTPAAFSVTALCLAWPLVLRDGLFDVIRLARREVLDHIADGVLVVDLRERLIYVNHAARRILRLQSLQTPCPVAEALGAHARLVQSMDEGGEIEIESDDGPRYFDLDVSDVRDHTGAVLTRALVLRDLTELKQASERVRANEQALREVVDLVPHPIYARGEDGRFLLVNRATAETIGKTPEDLIGRGLDDIGLLPEDTKRIRAADLAVSTGREKVCVDESVTIPDVGVMVFQTTKIPFIYPPTGSPALLGISIDVTERSRKAEQIRRLAFFDSLTGLPNRRRFLERLSRALETARRLGSRLCLLFVDLDRFKEVNDQLGHAAGDALLREVSRRLRESVRFSDHLAFADASDPLEAVSRLAGDEFTILLTNISSVAAGARVAERISAAIAQPFEVEGKSVSVDVSVGLASFPEDGDSVDELMRAADRAMYESKRRSQGPTIVHPAIRAQDDRRGEIEAELRADLEAGRLSLRFQPIRDARTLRLTGAEALLHWDNLRLGTVEPRDLVAVAEETGLISEIGTWALQESGAWLSRWMDFGASPPRVSVNVSVEQLREPALVARFAGALKPTGIGLHQVELEIAESALVDDESLRRALSELRGAGATLALDAFGTVESSTRSLRGFDFSRIKLDRSLVATLPESVEDTVLASGIIAMAHRIGLEVVAVGVESEAQAQCLREMGCDELQGFLIGRPISPEEFSYELACEVPEE